MKKGSIPVIPPLPLQRRAFYWLFSALALATSWHLPKLPIPVWLMLLVVLFFCLRRQIGPKRPPLPLRLMLTAAAIGVVLVAHGTISGKDAGISSLVLLVFLKLYEAKSNRDLQITAYIGFFLILAAVLDDQNLLVFCFVIIGFLVLGVVLRILQIPEASTISVGGLFRKVSTDLLLAAPIFLVLFILFPRSTQPLFSGLLRFPSWGRSGFSDGIHPGSISRLALSQAPALRVYFPPGRRPKNENLYFRGAVLFYTDGRSWFRGSSYSYPASEAEMESAELEYEIILEPIGTRWLFGIDRPVRFPHWAELNGAATFSSPYPISRPLRYKAGSIIHPRPEQEPRLSPVVRKWSLQLPRRLDPSIRELGEELRREAGSDREVIQAGLDYFRDHQFQYTLDVGLLDRDRPLADFLFITRKGFCEHFAAAYGLLMRVAGIPTRLVVGFLGGQDDRYDRYLLVRQADAHAWVEVWDTSVGWVRIDPTAVVAPERLQVQNTQTDNDGNRPGETVSGWRSGGVYRFFRRLWIRVVGFALRIENLWNYWVVTFGRIEQQELVRRVAGELLSRQVGFWVLGIALVSALVYSFLKWSEARRVRRDRLSEWFARYCRKLKWAGLERNPAEGPLAFLSRSCVAFPHSSNSLKRITLLYVELRYGRPLPHAAERMALLRKLIRRLEINK